MPVALTERLPIYAGHVSHEISQWWSRQVAHAIKGHDLYQRRQQDMAMVIDYHITMPSLRKDGMKMSLKEDNWRLWRQE